MPHELFDIGADGSVVIRLHVQPGAGRTAVVGRHGDALKVRVAAPPERGRANDACAELLARVLGVAEADVRLSSGQSSRSKRFTVSGADPAEVAKRLDVALDQSGVPPGGNAAGHAGVLRLPGR